MRHWNCLSFSWTFLLCLSTQLLVLKSWEQMRQWKDLSFSWTFLMWPLRWVLDLKALREQMWHWKVLSFSWTNFTWQLTACLSLNDLSQMWQRNSLWFWWTLLMWFRRVFCSLGTGHKLNTGRGWNGLERIPVHRWDVLEDLASVRSFVKTLTVENLLPKHSEDDRHVPSNCKGKVLKLISLDDEEGFKQYYQMARLVYYYFLLLGRKCQCQGFSSPLEGADHESMKWTKF